MKAQLILENGMRFSGEMFGDIKNVVGEVVFATGMTGYQEELTDPAFAGQIVTMTFPLVGNYGINLEDNESKHTSLNALVVREKCNYPSNFRNEMDIDDFLKSEGVVGLEGIDTRALTRVLRDAGSMKGAIMQGEPTDEEALAFINTFDNKNVMMSVTTKKTYVLNEKGTTHVAFIDLGTKESILKRITDCDCKVTVFPANATSADIEKVNPDIVFVSSGPGNPNDAPGTIETIKALLGKYPIRGICMGHLVIGLALGCKIQKMKFGHHGGNQPVKDTKTGKVYITAQTHNYVLCDYPQGVEEIFVNVNDGTCEGIMHKEYSVQSVQFHPEASPGPHDTLMLFDTFLKEVK